MLVSLGRKSASITLFISIDKLVFWLSQLVSQLTTQAPRNPMIMPINGLEMANQSGISSCKAIEYRVRVFVFNTLIFFSITSISDRLSLLRQSESEQLSKAGFVRVACRTITVGLHPFRMFDAQRLVYLPLKFSVRADLTARRKSIHFHSVKTRL